MWSVSMMPFIWRAEKIPTGSAKRRRHANTPSELLTGLDQSLPVFVIVHQPSELTELAEAGSRP